MTVEPDIPALLLGIRLYGALVLNRCCLPPHFGGVAWDLSGKHMDNMYQLFISLGDIQNTSPRIVSPCVSWYFGSLYHAGNLKL